MAYKGVAVDVGQSIGNGNYSVSLAGSDTTVFNSTAPDYTTVAADLATLVADGASPTQGHVTALNTAWGTFKTSLDTYTGHGVHPGHVSITYDDSAITNRNQMRAALRALVAKAEQLLPEG